MEDKQRVRMIRIASTISWVLGILYTLILAAIAIPIFLNGKALNALPFLALLVVLSVLYCVIGWGLRTFGAWAGILTLIVSGVTLISNILSAGTLKNPRSLIGVVINGAIFVLVILGWRSLK